VAVDDSFPRCVATVAGVPQRQWKWRRLCERWFGLAGINQQGPRRHPLRSDHHAMVHDASCTDLETDAGHRLPDTRADRARALLGGRQTGRSTPQPGEWKHNPRPAIGDTLRCSTRSAPMTTPIFALYATANRPLGASEFCSSRAARSGCWEAMGPRCD